MKSVSPAISASRAVLFYLAIVLAVSVKIWLVEAQDLTAMGGAVADDRLFLTLSESLLQGNWLGSYEPVTLVKGPFYPLWIAAVFQGGVPLLLAQHLLYVLACVVLLVALKPLISSPLVALMLFVAVLFNPMSYMSGITTQVLREGIYPALSILVFACAIGVLLRLEGSIFRLFVWAVFLGLTMSALWLTREEGVWVVPSMMFFLAAAGISLFRKKKAVFPKALILGIPLVLVLLSIGGVSSLNMERYGIYAVTEMKSPDFLAAYGALLRVRHAKWAPTLPVPEEVRERLYRASPAFAELKDFLNGEGGRKWGNIFKDIRELYRRDADFARRIDRYLKDDSSGIWWSVLHDNEVDIQGGWFVWAFRDAVADAGYYKSGKTAAEYYRRLAGEVNAACSDGRLECGPKRSSLMPPWHPGYAEPFLKSVASGVKSLTGFSGFEAEPIGSFGDEKSFEIFRKITREKLERVRTEVQNGNRVKLKVLTWIGLLYQAVTPFLSIAALIVYVILTVRFARKQLSLTRWTVVTALFAAILTRLLVLSLIHVTSFPANVPQYLAPLYPLLLICIMLVFFMNVERKKDL